MGRRSDGAMIKQRRRRHENHVLYVQMNKITMIRKSRLRRDSLGPDPIYARFVRHPGMSSVRRR